MKRIVVRQGYGDTRVVVVQDVEALARAAADRFVALARAAVESRGRFSVALSGGSTPGDTYRLLSTEHYRSQVPWRGVHLFWGDERCVPPDHDGSNYRLAREALIDWVPIPAENVHRVRGELVPGAAARSYDLELQDYFCGPRPRLDLVFLGLGSDGHIAALFPDSDALKATENVATVEAQYQDRPAWRVTLTLPAINAARDVLFMVSGGEKAAIVRAVLDDSLDSFPARHVRPLAGAVAWLIDEAAAAELTDRP
ncbi:MAG TPA: 6-phosphogluconolactonase [Anaerolineae bacterium]|nr:6-phosphogluconolactonase [Anaerolineae bacterium]